MKNQTLTTEQDDQEVMDKLIYPSKSNRSLIIAFVGVGSLLVVASLFVGIQIGKNQVPNSIPIAIEQTSKPVADLIETPPSASPFSAPAENWQSYSNSKYGFSLQYPENFAVKNLIEKPFYSLTEEVPFGIALLQNVYSDLSQTPMIKIQVIQTNKTIDQILSLLKSQIVTDTEAMKDPSLPGSYYKDAKPPQITSITKEEMGNNQVTKVERYSGPGAPNAELLEFYIQSSTYIYVLTANFGTDNPEIQQDGTVEKETLSKIVSTFNIKKVR